MKMKQTLLVLATLISSQAFAEDNSLLFGEYPAKYHCVKVGHQVKKCYMPTAEELRAEIENYISKHKEREEKLSAYLSQNSDLQEALNKMAAEKQEEIGDNAFSTLYRTYANKLDQMILKHSAAAIGFGHTSPEEVRTKMETLIGLGEGSYLETMTKVLDAIEAGVTEGEYANITLSNDVFYNQREYQQVTELTETTVSTGQAFRYNFTSLAPMNKSCTDVKGYGTLKTTNITLNHVMNIHPDSSYGFDIIKDKELIENLLVSNNGKPIEIECVKVAKGSDLVPTYDDGKKKMTIPYYTEKDFGFVAGSLSLETSKDIIYHKNGFFLEDLRDQL